MAQRYEYQDIDGHVILLFVHPAMTGGPAQAHVGTGGGGSSSDMPWGEKNKHGGRRR